VTQPPKVRFDAAAINHSAPIIDAPLLSWTVARPADGGMAFRVDLSQFAEGTNAQSPEVVKKLMAKREKLHVPKNKGYLSVAGHPDMIRALAPALRKWSYTVAFRTISESLSQLKHFFNFLKVADEIAGTTWAGHKPQQWQLTDISPELFQQFADYLRRLGVSSARMGTVYDSARKVIESASGYHYLPSNPFSKIGDGDGIPQYSHDQLKALLHIAKDTIRQFKQMRQTVLHGDGARLLRMYIKERLIGNLAFDGPPAGLPKRIVHNVFPGIRVTSAFVLLALLRSGANLQPVLDLSPRNWHWPNPFSPRYRTVVMTKNRRGNRQDPILVKIPTLKRPQFYLYRALRYYELLVVPLRNQIETRGAELSESQLQRQRVAAASFGNRFWLYINNNGELTELAENAATRGISQLIAEAYKRAPARYACLLDGNGEPIRFSSKAIRDGWFEFVLRNSRFNLVAGQIALSHSTDSPSIRHYIRHRWAKQFAEREMRRFQSAAVAVVAAKAPFGPKAISFSLSGGDIITYARKTEAATVRIAAIQNTRRKTSTSRVIATIPAQQSVAMTALMRITLLPACLS
jgi:hypothetical protein